VGDRGSLRIPRWLAEKMEDGRSVASSGGGRSPKPLSNAPGRGVMFRVRDKQNPKGPDFKGGLNVDGREFELAMWESISKGGTPYLSLSIKPAPLREEEAGQPIADDHDIPFGRAS
jgi:hypothetical protein